MTDNINNIEEIEASEEALSEPERIIVFEEALEAILFAAGHPISYATLGRVFDMTPAQIKDKVFEYSIKYNDSPIPRGVILLTYADSCQLCTKQYYLAEIREALGIKKSGSLSTSSLEALAIVAYNQPVTRVFVDTLRRVDSSYAMNNLLDRGLIESKGRLDAPGRPMLYGTTKDFLRCFGLKDISSLPKTTEELNAVFENAKLEDAEANAAENDAVEAEQIEIALDEATAEAASEDVAMPEAEAEAAPEFELEEPSADEDILDDM